MSCACHEKWVSSLSTRHPKLQLFLAFGMVLTTSTLTHFLQNRRFTWDLSQNGAFQATLQLQIPMEQRDSTPLKHHSETAIPNMTTTQTCHFHETLRLCSEMHQLFCMTYHFHANHNAIAAQTDTSQVLFTALPNGRAIGAGSEHLRTCANGCGRLRSRKQRPANTALPSDSQVKREPFATHSGKKKRQYYHQSSPKPSFGLATCTHDPCLSQPRSPTFVRSWLDFSPPAAVDWSTSSTYLSPKMTPHHPTWKGKDFLCWAGGMFLERQGFFPYFARVCALFWASAQCIWGWHYAKRTSASEVHWNPCCWGGPTKTLNPLRGFRSKPSWTACLFHGQPVLIQDAQASQMLQNCAEPVVAVGIGSI